MEFTDQQWQALIDKASKIGSEHGSYAASWVFDGNTSDDRYREVLAGIEDGDPQVLDTLPSPPTGENSDDYLHRDLMSDLYLPDDGDTDDGQLWDAYADAFDTAVLDTIETLAREHVAYLDQEMDG